MYYLDYENGKRAVYGGWFFGGGGGGMPDGGIEVLENALSSGKVLIKTIDEFDAGDSIVTASLVGSPSQGKDAITAEHCRRVYHLFKENYPHPLNGIISNETGAHSITNGWIAAAVNGLTVLDAACNGRAHPTGVMGAMSLDSKPGYITVQAAVGGSGENNLELCTKGSIESTSKLVREASTLSGGFITVLRNPIDCAYIKNHSAVGALSMCIQAGEVFLSNQGQAQEILMGLEDLYGSQVLATGMTEDFDLKARGGFDVGSVSVRDHDKLVKVIFWNEYMTVEDQDSRLATFPDLIALLDGETGFPICSAQISNGQRVYVVRTPRQNLLLSSTMFDKNLYIPCEEAIGKELISYVFQ